MERRFAKLVSQITVWHIAASICYYGVYAGTSLFRDAFSISGFEIGLVITSLTLGYAIFLFPIGIATDRFGEHRTLTLGLAGLTLGTVFVALAPSYWWLLVAVFLLGAAYGTATPGTNKAVFDNIRPHRQHRAIGIKQIGPPIGSAISALLITGLVGAFFWQAGFLVAAVIGAVCVVLFYITYGGASKAAPTYPDFIGLLSNRAYVLLVAAGTCIGAAFYTTTGYTVLYVEDSIGATVAVGGIVLALLQVSSSVGKLIAGWFADVFPGRPRFRIGAILFVQTLGGGALFFVLPLLRTPLEAGVVFSVLGLFVIGSTGIYYSCISALVGDDEIGAASAAGQFAVTLGGLFAPPTFGYLIDTTGYTAAWSFLGVLSVLGAALVAVVVLTAE